MARGAAIAIVLVLVIIWVCIVVIIYNKKRKGNWFDEYFFLEAIGELISAILSSLF
jgi:cbb3-type cytochrome oxidase subunit 3